MHAVSVGKYIAMQLQCRKSVLALILDLCVTLRVIRKLYDVVSVD